MKILVVFLALMVLVGCETKYKSSQIDLAPAYVGKETVRWCVTSQCPVGVREDLAQCQANAVKQDYRNDLDETVVKDDFGTRVLDGVTGAFKKLF